MIEKFKKENILYKIATLILIGAMLFLLFRIIQNAVLSLQFPNELLEPSNVSLTRMFLEGKTPYTLESLSYNPPAVNFEYPFINSLLSAGIAILIGGNAVLAHYIVSFASLLATGVLGFMLVKSYSKTTVAPLATALMFMICHWRYGFVSAAPDSLGLFLFILTVYLAVSPKIKNKSLVCAVLSTLCFYTKQYFIFVALGVFVYFLLYSRKEAIKFLMYMLGINIAAGILITVFWPLYWTYTFYFLYNGTFTGVGFGIDNLLAQMKYMFAIFAGFFAVIVFAFFYLFIRRKREKASRESSENNSNTAVKYQFEENNAPTLLAVQSVVQLLPLVYFGRNDGAYLTYFLQLWMPSIIALTFVIMEMIIASRNKILFDLIYGGIAAFTILFAYLKLPLHTITTEEIANWNRAYDIVNEYRQQGDVYYSQQLAYLAFENGDIYCMCGHDGEVSQETLDKWNESKFCRTLFPYAGQIMQKYIDYEISILVKAWDADFALLTYEDGNSMFFSDEFIDAGTTYVRLDKIPLQLGNMEYTVSFYELSDLWK